MKLGMSLKDKQFASDGDHMKGVFEAERKLNK